MTISEIKRININVGGVPSLGYVGGGEEFERISSVVGYSLPDVYLNFLRLADGGHPEVGCFELPGEGLGNYFDVDWFYSAANPEVENIEKVIADWGGVLGFGALPIGRDAGGNQIYLDLRDASPSVWLYLHDENERRVRVADSFDGFIANLVVNPDFI